MVVAGNSIGAYLSASLAGNYPRLARGVVLSNPAGRLIENYVPSEDAETVRATNPLFAELSARALFIYLQLTATNTLRRVYPNNPDNADEGFAHEIIRASADPGALGVFRSVFFLPQPRPLNYWLDCFGGPVLVL